MKKGLTFKQKATIYVIGGCILTGTLGIIQQNYLTKVVSQVSAKDFYKPALNVSKGECKATIEKPKVVKEEPKLLIAYKNGTEDQKAILKYLWDKTHDIDMILTFNAESKLNPETIGRNKKVFQVEEIKDGKIQMANVELTTSTDHGLCQLNTKYHLPFISSEDFQDIYKQADYCIKVWQQAKAQKRQGNIFIAYKYRNNPSHRNRLSITQEAYDIYNKSK